MLRIKELRTEMGLTQKELGAQINSTSKNIWAYENEIAVPPLDVLIRLSKVFNCSIEYLAGLTNNFDGVSVPAIGEQLTDDEAMLLKYYRGLPPTNKLTLFKLMQSLFDTSKDIPLKKVESFLNLYN